MSNILVICQSDPSDPLARYHHDLPWGDNTLNFLPDRSGSWHHRYQPGVWNERLQHVLDALMQVAPQCGIEGLFIRNWFLAVALQPASSRQLGIRRRRYEEVLEKSLAEDFSMVAGLGSHYHSKDTVEMVRTLPGFIPRTPVILKYAEIELPPQFEGGYPSAMYRGDGCWGQIRASDAAKMSPALLRLLDRIHRMHGVGRIEVHRSQLRVGVGLAFSENKIREQVLKAAESLAAQAA